MDFGHSLIPSRRCLHLPLRARDVCGGLELLAPLHAQRCCLLARILPTRDRLQAARRAVLPCRLLFLCTGFLSFQLATTCSSSLSRLNFDSSVGLAPNVRLLLFLLLLLPRKEFSAFLLPTNLRLHSDCSS